MNNSQIGKINATCLFEIFKQIKIKCETQKHSCKLASIKYADLVNFVVTFEWLRYLFYHWDKELFKLLRIGAFESKDNNSLTIDFGVLYNGLQGATQKERDTFFKLVKNGINQLQHLHEACLTYTSDAYFENHLDFFEMIMESFQTKRFLKYLEIDMKGYSVEKLSHLRQLESLKLNAKIDSEELVECCKSNPNMRILQILNNEMLGRLSDITLDDTNLQNLQGLEFLMKHYINAVEYAPLAKLPRLKELIIHGNHEIGSLRQLFSGLAAKSNLSTLIIINASLNDAEIQAISQIKSLKQLKCGLIEVKSISQLSYLSKLARLEMTSNHELSKMLPEISKILRVTKVPYINILFYHGEIRYTKLNEKLIWIAYQKVNEVTDSAPLCQVTNLRDLEIMAGNITNGSLVNLFKGIANRMPHILQYLKVFEIQNIGLNCNEIAEMSAIKSLKSINCTLGDLSNIYALGELPQLEKLIINISTSLQKDETEGLKKLFRVLASSPFAKFKSLDLSGLLIDLPIIKELVEIKTLKTLKCSFSNEESIEYLDKFTELEDLEIRSKHDFKEISNVLLHILLSYNANIKINKDLFKNSFYLSSCNKQLQIEITLATKVNLTQYLPLEYCHSIVVTGECQLGSLHSLIQTLSAKQNNILKLLSFETYTINFEETILISQIKSLEKLICKFSDPRNFEVVLPQIHFKEINVNTNLYANQFLDCLNNSRGIVNINTDGRLIEYYEIQAKLILETLYKGAEKVDSTDYACLGNLPNLQILHIIGENKSGSLKNLFCELALNSKPKELIIKKGKLDKNIVTINSDELLETSKIKSLRKLKCGFSNSISNIETLAQLKDLQELTITTHQYGSLQGFLKKLSSQTSTPLQLLSIEKEITFDELLEIACISSLKRLKCNFTNTENRYDPFTLLPHLTDLCIKSHRRSTLSNKLRLFTSSALQNITIMGDSLDYNDFSALAQIKSIRKLHINLLKLESVNLLFPLNQLEDLHIELNKDENSNELMLNLPKYFQNLQKLTISNIIIGSKDIANILQLPSLKSLNCIIDIEDNENLGRLGYLQELIITPKSGCLKLLLQTLAKYSTKSLKNLAIDSTLNLEEIVLLSQIGSLSTLQCGLPNDESLHYLSQLSKLKALKITSIINLNNQSDQLLNIIRYCIQLESIDLTNSEEEMVWIFIHKILNLLKNVRNPILQKPLKLKVPATPRMYHYKLTSQDERYLILE